MVTIRDVAKKAGVSPATVSRILSGDATFSASEETRRKVALAVQELGYAPYLNYRQGRKAKAVPAPSGISVGIVTSAAYGKGKSTASYLTLYNDVERELLKNKFYLSFSIPESELEDPVAFDSYFSSPPEALIYIVRLKPSVFDKLQSIVPVGIGVDSYYPSLDNVTYDKERGMEAAVAYLYARGRRRIAYIGGPGMLRADLQTSRRFDGYQKGLLHHNLPFREEYVKNCFWLVDICYQQARELLTLPELPDAIICGGDSIHLFSIYRAIYEKNLRIPEDIAVISCTQSTISDFITPAPTSLEIPTRLIAATAVEMLSRRLNGLELPPIEIIYPVKLIARDSA